MSFSRIRRLGLGTAVAAALITTSPAAVSPASAMTCGPVIPCAVHAVAGPDITGGVYGWACMGLFTPLEREGTRDYWSGKVAGATYLHTDVDARSMTVTCSVRTGSTDGSGTVRGSVTASSVPPFNFTSSAAGLRLDYWETVGVTGERLWLCTTVRWTDRYGFAHSHSYDANENVSGAQCLELVPLLPV